MRKHPNQLSFLMSGIINISLHSSFPKKNRFVFILTLQLHVTVFLLHYFCLIPIPFFVYPFRLTVTPVDNFLLALNPFPLDSSFKSGVANTYHFSLHNWFYCIISIHFDQLHFCFNSIQFGQFPTLFNSI